MCFTVVAMAMHINSLMAFHIDPFFVLRSISEQTQVKQSHFVSTSSRFQVNSKFTRISYLLFEKLVKMRQNKLRKRFESLLTLFLFTIPTLNHANPLLIDIKPSILTESMQTMIEYMTKLFCSNQFTYRFNHIYVERSLSTGLADKLINQINGCMTAGVLVSRYH